MLPLAAGDVCAANRLRHPKLLPDDLPAKCHLWKMRWSCWPQPARAVALTLRLLIIPRLTSDRARRVVSDGGAMGGACGDALRLRCERRRKSYDQGGRQYAVKPHATNPHCIVEGRHVAANEGFSAAVGTGAAAVCRLPGKCGKSIT